VNPHPRVVKWRKPEPGFVKANLDVNMKIPGHWGLGAIIRNEEGLVMVAATWLSPRSEDPLLAEAYALFRTMVLARECGFQRIIFESDSELLVRKVKEDRIHNRSYLGYLIDEIRRQQCLFATCSFSFTHRSGNKIAHHMAQLGHEKPNEVWIEEVPVAIDIMYFHDLMN
jgi:ribonuclease HI